MEIAKIDGLIYSVRGRRVMLDADLAALYGIKTKELNKAVMRNPRRFPEAFAFTLTREEAENLRFQTGTSSWGGRRYLPRAFTEHGVVMLSSVLKSDRAIRLNIEVVNAFVRLHQAVAASSDLARRLEKVEKTLDGHGAALGEHAEAIQSVFEDIRALIGAPEGPKRRIGF